MGAVLKFEKKYIGNMMKDTSKRAQVLNKIEERNLNKTVAKCDAEQKHLKRQIVEIREARKVVMENVKHLSIGETERRSAQSQRKQKYPIKLANGNKLDHKSCPIGKLESVDMQVGNKILLDMFSNRDGIKAKQNVEDNNNEVEINLDLKESKLGISKMPRSVSSLHKPFRRSSLPDISVLSRDRKHCETVSNLALLDSVDESGAAPKDFSQEICIPLKLDREAGDISERIGKCVYNPVTQTSHDCQSLPSISTKPDQSCKAASPRPSDASPRPSDVLTPMGCRRLRERRRTIADLRADLNQFARTQTSNDDNVKASRVLGTFRQLGHTSLGATILNRRRHSLDTDSLGLKAKQLPPVRSTDNPTAERSEKSRLQQECLKRQQEVADLNQKAWSLRRKSSR